MSVVSVKELFDQARSEYRDGKTTHTKMFLVIVDSIADGPDVALYANDGSHSVPAAGAPFKSGSPLILLAKTADRHGGGSKQYAVRCEFALPTFAQRLALAVDPLSVPDDIQYGAINIQEEYFKDTTGATNSNSAGVPFENARTRDKAERSITITRNAASFNPVAMAAYDNTTNLADVVIDGVTYTAGNCKIDPPTAVKTPYMKLVSGVETEAYYYKVTFTVHYRPGTSPWIEKLLDVGLEQVVSGKRVPILGADGLAVQKPYPLNGSGAKAATPTTAPELISLVPYLVYSWAGLSFT